MTGRLVAWLLLLMMLLTCLVVVLRYAFNIGSIGLQESVVYLHGCVFMLGISYTLKRNAHVRVDILYQKFSDKQKALVDLFGCLVFLFPFCIFVGYDSAEFVRFSWRLLESSAEPGGLPGVYLLKSLIPILAITLLVQGISEFLKNLQTLIYAAHQETG